MMTKNPLMKMARISLDVCALLMRTPPIKNTVAMETAMAAMNATNLRTSFCRVDSRNLVPEASPAMVPIAVLSPVSTTMPIAIPSKHKELLKATFLHSKMRVSFLDGRSLQDIGSDSPVSEEHSDFKPRQRRRTKSAGTLSPSLIMTRSPTTRSPTGTSTCFPSRMTLHETANILEKESMILNAFPSS